MTAAILLGTVAALAISLLIHGLRHLRESVGPWTLDDHEYDDAWRASHRA